MKRKITFLIAALFALILMTTPTVSWGQTKAAVFTETFNSCSGTGGYDTNGNFENGNPSGDIVIDNSNWSFTKGNAANKCAKFGTSSKKGSAETPEISISGLSKLTLTFKAAAWDGTDEQTQLNLSSTNCTLKQGNTTITNVTMTKGAWTTYTVDIEVTNTSNPIKIKFEGKQDSKARFFLDEVVVTPKHTISYAVSPSETGSVSGKDAGNNNVASGTYITEGATVTLTASPISGYQLSSWSDGGNNSTLSNINMNNNTATFTMGTSNVTITATFVSASSDPTITINTPTGGTITVENGDDEVENGDQIAEGTFLGITATPAEGYSFTSWSVTEDESGDDVVLYDDESNTPNGFDMPAVNVTVDATFTKNNYRVDVNSIVGATISASYNSGSNTISAGNYANVEYGTSITLNATGNAANTIVVWDVYKTDSQSTKVPVSNNTITVPAYAITITGTVVNTYTVTYDGNTNTDGSAPTDSYSPYVSGSTVTVLGQGTLVKTDNVFSGWNTDSDGNGTSYDEGDTFNISENTTLYAQWVPTYTITSTASNGTVGVYQNQKSPGDTVRLKVTPAAGYYLVGLKVKKTSDGSVTNIVPEYNGELNRHIFTMPAYNVTVKGVFDQSNEVTYNFSEISGLSGWTSYAEHTVSYEDADVTFASACIQASTITDIPVTKGGDVTLVMKEENEVTKKITGITFVCRQWGTKAQTITLHYSTDNGDNYTSTGVTSTNFTISKTNLATGTDAVKITFNSQSNQVGIESATIAKKAENHNVTLGAVTNGTIGRDKETASKGETVTLTQSPSDGYILDYWTVTYTADGETFSVPVTNNKFTMPNYAVNVSAVFRLANAITITYSVNGNESSIDPTNYYEGNSVELPDASLAGFVFKGWSATEGSTVLVSNPYTTPSSDITLYAVFALASDNTITITPSTANFPTSYGDLAEYNLEGKNFKIEQAYINNNKLQWKASQGKIYNSENFGRITSIVIVYDGDNNKNFTVFAGTTENPTEGDEIAPTPSSNTYTFDLSGDNYTHFVMANGSGAGYLSSIAITYEKNYSTITNVSSSQEIDDDIELNELIIVGSTATLKFNGDNNGNAENLIIESGGKLITTKSVPATVKKTITAPSSKVYGWYTISSPVHTGDNSYVTIGAETTVNLTSGSYDMFAYDEASATWINQKATLDPLTFAIDEMYAGQGFMYRSSGNTISFVGNTNYGTVDCALSCSGPGKLKGFNLIGNPYTHSIAKGSGKAIDNSKLSNGCYALTNSGIWTPIPDGNEILPEQGILVEVSEAVADFQILDKNYSGGGKYNNDNIKFTISNNLYEDVAYAWFDKGIGLSKINHRDENAPMIYIPQESKNYAIATMSDDTKVFGLNIKVASMGQYTLSYKADGNFDYLHIIDRLTGEDIDMLLEGQYTFVATPNDNDNRFIVNLAYKPNYGEGNNENFAYQSGNEILVSGSGELQIFDVTGRSVMTTTINGVESINIPAQGVYIFRLNEKVQKIVVR